jgi:hypothetical protein
MKRFLSATIATLAACIPFLAEAADDIAFFESKIRPLLIEHCLECHATDTKQKGGLLLDSRAGWEKGGDNGPAVVPGDAASSLLIKAVTWADKDLQMPPKQKLAESEIAALTEWVKRGAPDPREKPALASANTKAEHPKPDGRNHWAFQPVKRPPVPQSQHPHPLDAFLFGERAAPARASEGALLRRVHLDLSGLPPTIDEQRLHAERSDLSAVIDDLLSRPEHGERWARHWLDVVRYADSNGYERDAEKPFVWRYRDYVIEALNKDKPFDRFILEQIAGDELPDATVETHIATGFLRVGSWDDQPGDPKAYRYDQLDDIVSTTSLSFLGLTIGCARCHDHKLEPLTSRDYYSLVAVFNPLQTPQTGIKELTVNIDGTEVYALTEPSAKAPDTHILVRGSATRPGELVQPAVPAILVKQQPAFTSSGERTTGRRLALAKWIADESNPLTARVIVNRVWQQHFGSGLVESANDFGLVGAAPAHPELLDWLAHWFMHDSGWSLKKLHRLILTSRAWQSVKTEDSLVRYRRLEVEAIRDSMLAVSGQLNPKRFGPAIRPPIPLAAIEANADKSSIWKPSAGPDASRRSIYVFVKRGLIVPMFESFDVADTASSCPKRQVTTVAPQALTLFNGDFCNEQARHLAARLKREAGDDAEKQIKHAWRLALCRDPTADELGKMMTFLQAEPLEQLCRVILNLNEFVYPE